MNHACMNVGETRESAGCLTIESGFLRRQPQGGVIAGLSRPKDGVASLAYDPAIHERLQGR
jgi:hypothetical protein